MYTHVALLKDVRRVKVCHVSECARNIIAEDKTLEIICFGDTTSSDRNVVARMWSRTILLNCIGSHKRLFKTVNVTAVLTNELCLEDVAGALKPWTPCVMAHLFSGFPSLRARHDFT